MCRRAQLLQLFPQVLGILGGQKRRHFQGSFAGPMCDVCGCGFQVYMSHLMIIWLKSSLHRCSSNGLDSPGGAAVLLQAGPKDPTEVVKTEGQDASYALGPAKGIDH